MAESLFDEIMLPEPVRPPRTVVVTLVCLANILYLVLLMGYLLIHLQQHVYNRLALLIGLILIFDALFVSLLLFVWQMRKWAGIIFTGFFGAATVRLWAVPHSPVIPVLCLISAVGIASQLGKMK